MRNRLAGVFCLLFLFVMGFDSNSFAHTDLTVEEAAYMIDSNNELIIIDVREESEYCGPLGHIPEALNYPLISGELEKRYSEIPIDAEILVVCSSGHRSHLAADFLDSKGYLYVYDMVGGMLAWQRDTDVCELPWGAPASIVGNASGKFSITLAWVLLLTIPAAVATAWKSIRAKRGSSK